MYQHIVLLRLRNIDDHFFSGIVSRLAQLREALPFMLGYDFVHNAARRSAGYEWAVIGTFSTATDHERYQISDAHKTFEAFMAEYIEDLIVLDADLSKT